MKTTIFKIPHVPKYEELLNIFLDVKFIRWRHIKVSQFLK